MYVDLYKRGVSRETAVFLMLMKEIIEMIRDGNGGEVGGPSGPVRLTGVAGTGTAVPGTAPEFSPAVTEREAENIARNVELRLDCLRLAVEGNVPAGTPAMKVADQYWVWALGVWGGDFHGD